MLVLSAAAAAGSTAASFNGTTSYATAPLSLSSISKITVVHYLNWTTFANNDSLSMEYGPNGNNTGAFLCDPNSSGPDAGKWDNTVSGTSSQITTGGIVRPSAGAWHHFAIVLDTTSGATGAIPNIYIDGSAQSITYGSNAFVVGSGFSNLTLYLMCRNASALFAAGAMAKLAIYPVVLSAANVASIAGGADPLGFSPRYYWTMSSGTVGSEANLGSGGTAALSFFNTATVAGP